MQSIREQRFQYQPIEWYDISRISKLRSIAISLQSLDMHIQHLEAQRKQLSDSGATIYPLVCAYKTRMHTQRLEAVEADKAQLKHQAMCHEARELTDIELEKRISEIEKMLHPVGQARLSKAEQNAMQAHYARLVTESGCRKKSKLSAQMAEGAATAGDQQTQSLVGSKFIARF